LRLIDVSSVTVGGREMSIFGLVRWRERPRAADAVAEGP